MSKREVEEFASKCVTDAMDLSTARLDGIVYGMEQLNSNVESSMDRWSKTHQADLAYITKLMKGKYCDRCERGDFALTVRFAETSDLAVADAVAKVTTLLEQWQASQRVVVPAATEPDVGQTTGKEISKGSLASSVETAASGDAAVEASASGDAVEEVSGSGDAIMEGSGLASQGSARKTPRGLAEEAGKARVVKRSFNLFHGLL